MAAALGHSAGRALPVSVRSQEQEAVRRLEPDWELDAALCPQGSCLPQFTPVERAGGRFAGAVETNSLTGV